MKRATTVLSLLLAAGLLLGAASSAPAVDDKTLILATTTSTQDSGLLEALIPAFQTGSGFFVKTIAVGSGQAMAMGAKGEADVLLVHSPADEERFMKGGFGVDRRLVMHNDFVVLGPSGGPAADPAGIRGLKSSAEAFSKIAAAGALFLSRADKSGTHSKELGLWKAAGVAPAGNRWYQETGLGMGQTLAVASEKGGYTLADRGTYLAMRKNLALEILLEGDAGLLNVYHVMGVNPARWPRVNAAGAKAFGDFMVSPATQDVIRTFGLGRYGAPLFFPDAGKDEATLGK